MASIKKIKRKKGTVYKTEIRLRGHKYVSKTFRRLAEARDWVRRTEREMRLSGTCQENVRREYTLHALIEEVEQLRKEIHQLKEDFLQHNHEGV
jgi:polyhydroxyalkanoate synthesis regulator phasin